MEAQQARTHSFWLVRSDAQPQQMHLLCECGGIGKYAVVIRPGIEFPVAEDEHPSSSAESANVGEEIKMIEGDLEGLHSSHRKPRHGTVIAIRKCPESRINIRDQNFSYIVFECGCHV